MIANIVRVEMQDIWGMVRGGAAGLTVESGCRGGGRGAMYVEREETRQKLRG